MKFVKIILILLLSPLLIIAQENKEKEKSSGKQSFSIKKKPETVKSSGSLQFNISKSKISEASSKGSFNIKQKDEIAPIITIITPSSQRGFKIVEDNKFLNLIGKVEDESGIFEVSINDKEVEITEEGLFYDSIPLAYGNNVIVIKATDIEQNTGVKELVVERKAELITSVEKTSNRIVWQSPKQDNFSTPLEIFNIKACIESSAKLKEIRIFQNDWKIHSIGVEGIEFEGDCDYTLNEEVSLKFGANNIKVEVESEKEVFESKITIVNNLINTNYHALIIGIQEYDDEAINDLSEPLNNARELMDVLKAEYVFEPENIIYLENPTKAEIIGTLHKMRSTITKEDNLLIFYAGHGYWDEAMNNGYWLPSDANQDNPVNWLPNTDLTNYLSVIKSKHTLLIADACFSGGIFKSRKAFNNSIAMEKLYRLQSRKAITSGTLKEVPDKSVFLQYFIKRLTENTNKYLSAEELYSSLRMAVINNSPNIPQYGTIQNVGDEGGDFIFIRRD